MMIQCVVWLLAFVVTSDADGLPPHLKGGMVTRFTDLNDILSKSTSGPETGSKALLEALRARHRVSRQPGSSNLQLLSEGTGAGLLEGDRFLWCFLGEESAGIVTQLRALISCGILAQTTGRIMLSPPLLATGFPASSWPRFWSELVDLSSTGLPGLKWADGYRGRAAEPNSTMFLDIHYSANRLPKWVETFVTRYLGFQYQKKLTHGLGESLASIGKSRSSAQTIFVVFNPEESTRRRPDDALVARLSPVPWLCRIAELSHTELFPSYRRYMAMTIVRGNDLAKCLAQADVARFPARIDSSTDNDFSDFVRILRLCFSSDSDVTAVVDAIQKNYGPLGVYLTGDEKSESSLSYFQSHGFKTRLDSSVTQAHLRPMDSTYLDFVFSLNSTLFIGSSKSKFSKQIVALREAIDLPSFILKSEEPSGGNL